METILHERRASVLRAHGAGPAEVDELLIYNESPFRAPGQPARFPLPDEPCVAAWEGYAALAGEDGVWEVLRARLPQLRFPVREGIGATEEYRAATLRGAECWPDQGVELREPRSLRLFIHPTAAGRLPVLAAGCRDDFATLVRALAYRGEPRPVPPSMGALAVGGFANWDRVAAHRRAWSASHDSAGWADEMRALAARPELYQDRFVILSPGPYSGVPARAVAMPEAEWDAMSMSIRLEHECAHYFSRRLFGAMRNNAFDELVADYAGMVAAAGRYEPGWALRFLGLEEEERFLEDGRLGSYRGTPRLTDGAFRVLCSLVRAAAGTLGRVDEWRRGAGTAWSMAERAPVLAALLRLTLEDLAANDSLARFWRAWRTPWSPGASRHHAAGA